MIYDTIIIGKGPARNISSYLLKKIKSYCSSYW